MHGSRYGTTPEWSNQASYSHGRGPEIHDHGPDESSPPRSPSNSLRHSTSTSNQSDPPPNSPQTGSFSTEHPLEYHPREQPDRYSPPPSNSLYDTWRLHQHASGRQLPDAGQDYYHNLQGTLNPDMLHIGSLANPAGCSVREAARTSHRVQSTWPSQSLASILTGHAANNVSMWNDAQMDARPQDIYQGSRTYQAISSPPMPCHQSPVDISQNSFNIQSEFSIQGYPFPQPSIHHESPLRFVSREDLAAESFETLGRTKTFPSGCDICDNPGISYPDISTWLLHSWTEHPLPTWISTTCLWEGCQLKKQFRTHRSWLEHANNVHRKIFRCPNCRSGPFGSRAMVSRHCSSKHTTPIPCSKAHCQGRKNINLARKDKLSDHDARWHGPLQCKADGCLRKRIHGEDYGFTKKSDLEKHVEQKHRQFKVASLRLH